MRILASDFDGTIYFEDDSNKNINNIKSINDFIKRGNIFCIITGRNYSDIKLLLNKYGVLYSYLICEDGAKIYNNMDYCIDTIYLDRDVVNGIKLLLEDNGWDYYLDDGYNKTTNIDDCVKIVVTCNDLELRERIVLKIRNNFPVYVYASRSHVNIVDNSVNKASGIKRLFNLEGLNYSLLRVIGDNDNDYEMLKEFRGGVIKEHNKVLDDLEKREYDTLSEYIDYILYKDN